MQKPEPDKKRKRVSRLSIRQATVLRLLVAFVVIGVIFALGMVLTYQIADAQKDSYYAHRAVQATTAAAAIDIADVEVLTGTPADIQLPAYQRLRSQLIRIKDSDRQIRFVYLMKPRGDKLIFLVDAEDPSSADFSPPGQVYEETLEGDLEPFDGRKAPVTDVEGPITDRWGTWISTSAYITDRSGKALALLGTDVDAERALTDYDQTRNLGTLFDLLALALLVLVALQWVVWRYNRDQREELRREMEESLLRLNEELVEADAMKSEFVQLASHELRGPVNAVNIAVQAIDNSLGPRLSEDEKNLVDVAGAGTSRLVDLVDNLLDVTRLEAGDFVLKPQVVDVEELVNKTVKLFEPLAEKKGISVEAGFPGRELDAFLDPQALLRVLENLVSNAIKFTDEGRIVIAVQDSPDSIEFSVCDTGTGIPETFRDEIFKKFSKLDSPGGQRRRGAGMGLALCRGLVEAQSGKIWFESTEGEGTTFHFAVPRFQGL